MPMAAKETPLLYIVQILCLFSCVLRLIFKLLVLWCRLVYYNVEDKASEQWEIINNRDMRNAQEGEGLFLIIKVTFNSILQGIRGQRIMFTGEVSHSKTWKFIMISYGFFENHNMILFSHGISFMFSLEPWIGSQIHNVVLFVLVTGENKVNSNQLKLCRVYKLEWSLTIKLKLIKMVFGIFSLRQSNVFYQFVSLQEFQSVPSCHCLQAIVNHVHYNVMMD